MVRCNLITRFNALSSTDAMHTVYVTIKVRFFTWWKPYFPCTWKDLFIVLLSIPEFSSNSWINMYETLTPATAKGYSHVALIPCVFSNNLWKAACQQFKQVSPCHVSLQDLTTFCFITGTVENKWHTGYLLAKNKRFSSETNPQPLKIKIRTFCKLCAATTCEQKN